MATTSVDVLIEGGKATAAPPLGPAMGPLGVNIGQVVADINKKTAEFKGMQVPVKVTVDQETKSYTITVGTPPASALIKKEAGVQKGSGKPHQDFIADLKIEQIIKIAKMKEDSLSGKTMKDRVKEIVGTCRSLGVKVEEVPAEEAIKMIDEGKFDSEIKSGKTEISAEEKKEIEEERARLQKELESKRAIFEAQAKKIVDENAGKEPHVIKKALEDAKLPDEIIHKFAPKTDAKAGGKGAQAKK